MGVEKKRNEIEGMLINSGIRPTPARMLILHALDSSVRPLSANDIESIIDTLDRSSITRALPLLLKARLVHQISDGSGSMKYELCRDEKNHREHDDEHAHFHCRICGGTTCLEDIVVKLPALPRGYRGEALSYVISGICPACNQSGND